MLELKKGDKVEIKNNSILGDCMGIPVATGEVFCITNNGKSFSFRCEQTGSLEGCDINDGEIKVVNK